MKFKKMCSHRCYNFVRKNLVPLPCTWELNPSGSVSTSDKPKRVWKEFPRRTRELEPTETDFSTETTEEEEAKNEHKARCSFRLSSTDTDTDTPDRNLSSQEAVWPRSPFPVSASPSPSPPPSPPAVVVVYFVLVKFHLSAVIAPRLLSAFLHLLCID